MTMELTFENFCQDARDEELLQELRDHSSNVGLNPPRIKVHIFIPMRMTHVYVCVCMSFRCNEVSASALSHQGTLTYSHLHVFVFTRWQTALPVCTHRIICTQIRRRTSMHVFTHINIYTYSCTHKSKRPSQYIHLDSYVLHILISTRIQSRRSPGAWLVVYHFSPKVSLLLGSLHGVTVELTFEKFQKEFYNKTG